MNLFSVSSSPRFFSLLSFLGDGTSGDFLPFPLAGDLLRGRLPPFSLAFPPPPSVAACM